jgi:sigma-B regulation protein RsbQ
MKKNVYSSDKTQIVYELTGNGDTALLFVHGWLGNKRWWDSQRDYLSDRYLIAQMDLAGHGESQRIRTDWSSSTYADDIVAVANDLPAKNIILVGHSMSGAYCTEASLKTPKLKGIILVDTLTNLDQLFTLEQASELLNFYRVDFNAAVYNILPQYLFASTSPLAVKAELQKEFVSHDPNFAADALEPFYKIDVRKFASQVSVPVRAINSDMAETSKENNSKYFRDFDFKIIKGVGHYPMLENPTEFNIALSEAIQECL